MWLPRETAMCAVRPAASTHLTEVWGVTVFPLCDRLGRQLSGTIAFSPGLVSSSDVATPDLFNAGK